MSKSRQKGTAAEAAVVRFLNTPHGSASAAFPYAERRALHGNADKGDVTGCGPLMFEVKAARTYKFPEWMKEVKEQTENAKADYGFLICKPNGVGFTRTGDFWAVMTLADLVNLLRDAGYGEPRD